MKKIIALMITSILLTSCFGGTENKEDKTNTEAKTEVNNTIIEKDTENKDVNNVVEGDNEEGDNEEGDNEELNDDEEKIIEVNNDDENIKISITDDNKNEKESAPNVSDEEALETEVNDLLDEFIDSLDSYDK